MKQILHAALLGSLLGTSFAAVAGHHDLIEGNAAYAVDPRGYVVRNNFGDCWRTSSWTQELAINECDPHLFPEQAAAPAATPAPAPAPAPQKVEKTRTLGASALFAINKADISDAGRAELDALVADLRRMDKVDSIMVVGHTDNTGAADYNMGLSQRRADSVKAYLVDKGIDANLITTKGMGLTQPVASNATREGRAQNRRVEISIKGSEIVVVQ